MSQNVIHSTIKDLLHATAGASGFTFTNTNTTVNGNLDAHQLLDLIAKCEIAKCDVKLASGVLTIVPKLTQ